MAQEVVTVLLGFLMLALLLQGAYGISVPDFVSGILSWFNPGHWMGAMTYSASAGVGGLFGVLIAFAVFIWLARYAFFDVLGGVDGLMAVLVFLIFLVLVI